MIGANETVLLKECQIWVYNLREAGMLQKFLEQQSVWGMQARGEYLCDGRVALIILPGGARKARR